MVLVSVLGDFSSSILPIIYNFKDDITKHVLVHDNFKRDVVKSKEILKGLQRFKEKYNLTFELMEYTLDEDSAKDIDLCSEFILSQTNNFNEVYINTTDGFSTLTTLLTYKLMPKNVNFLAYDMYDNEYNILNNKNLSKHKLINNLNIVDHFLLKGYHIEKKEFKEFANKYENIIKSIFEKHHIEFDEYVKLPRNKYARVDDLPDSKLKKLFINMELNSFDPHNPFITGGLFEYYIYNLLKNLEYDDIEVGLVVKRNYAEFEVPNEFDILIMKNNHLHTIECKYRNMINLSDLIYKYSSLSNSVVDEDGKIVIIIKKPIKYQNENNSLNSTTGSLKRASLSGIVFKGGVHLNPKLFSIYIQSLLELKKG